MYVIGFSISCLGEEIKDGVKLGVLGQSFVGAEDDLAGKRSALKVR